MATKTYTPLQKNDFVLELIKDNKVPMYYMPILKDSFKSGISQVELEAIIKRLSDDNYIMNIGVNEFEKAYIATFDGILFQGYAAAEKQKADQESRLKHIEENQMNQAMQMTNLTWAIAGGTIVAAVYYITQLVDWFKK